MLELKIVLQQLSFSLLDTQFCTLNLFFLQLLELSQLNLLPMLRFLKLLFEGNNLLSKL